MSDEEAVKRGDVVPEVVKPEPVVPAASADADKGDEADEADLKKAKNADETDETDEKDEKDDPKKRVRVPLARLDEVTRKARVREETLNNRIQELETKLKEKDVDVGVSKLKEDLSTLKDKYEDLVLDGKKADAKQIRAKIEALEEQLIDHKTASRSEAARQQAVQDLKYESALAKAEADWPDLNPDHEDFDQNKTEEVGVLLKSFISAGFHRNVALEKAVKYVMGVPGKKSAEDVDAIKKSREVEARKKATDAEKRQPAQLKDIGKDSDKNSDTGGIDVMRLTPGQFEKLSEETIAKLRGDFL